MEDSFEAHSHGVQEVAARFGVDLSQGLSEAQVHTARSRYGKNELKAEDATPLWKVILKQFDDLLVKILLVAAVVDLVIALSDGQSFLSSLVEPSVILLILIANATVGVITEKNAEKAIEELKAYEAENALVIRGGKPQVVPAQELVPGDVVEVAVGNKIPADLRMAQLLGSMLKVDQSILTGECLSVTKQLEAVSHPRAVLQDKTCILFSGTLVTTGRARGIVVGTGANTAIGKVRDAMAEQEEALTPLKKKLDEFGELLSKVIAGICVLVWLMNINRFKDPALGGWVSGAIYYFKTAVALAVAAIPEGLPAVVTTCLALGTRKMAKQNAIVRSLPSVETLGCTTVICSDKTGTLTTNQMSVVKVAVLQSSAANVAEFDVTGTTFSPQGAVMGPGGSMMRSPHESPCLLHLAICSALCNDSTASYSQATGVTQRMGEATELALRVFAEKVGLPLSAPQVAGVPGRDFLANASWQSRFVRQSCLDFSRDRKMMSVMTHGDGKSIMWSKGAPESILQRCTYVLTNGGEGVLPLSDAMRSQMVERLQQYGGRQALRCLALAFKQLPMALQQVSLEDESGLTLIGLVAMHDPPRPEVRTAIETCRGAGIRVIMVTGDNKATAEAVARQVGAVGASQDISGPYGVSWTGTEFDEMSSLEQVRAAETMSLFSRVEPLHKLRLVELLKAQGHVVAMTGDGVNDAPALVKADIGVAMGSGTAVAKEAADMVLADDNFASIVAAVAEGRAIYNNTKQFIRYMISSNIGEVVAIFLAALLGVPEVLTPVQLLWVNLVTDGLPATALGFNRPDRDIMTTMPRRVDEPIVNGWLFLRYLVIGLYVGVATILGFIWWFMAYAQGGNLTWQALSNFQKCEEATAKAAGYSCDIFLSRNPRTISMSVLVVIEMFNALNNLSENASLLQIPPWDNRWLLGAIATSMALHCFILYFPPAAAMFKVTPLSSSEWLCVLYLSLPVILLDEVMKAVGRARARKARAAGRSFGSAPSSVPASIEVVGGHEAGIKVN